MREQMGNLSAGERLLSAAIGIALPALLLRGRHTLVRALAAPLAGAFVARAVAGHCGVKSAMSGYSSLLEGLLDQWRCMVSAGSAKTHGLPGSPRYRKMSREIDEAVEESFPASDPPASRLPDEPPANASAKWEAARRKKD